MSTEEKPEKDWEKVNTWKTGQMNFKKIKTKKCTQAKQS